MSDANTPNLLMAFVGDDFTGSTDAMESLAQNGIHTILFTDVPTTQQLKRYPDLQAFGVASLTRSLPTDQIASHIKPIFAGMRNLGAPIVHYKTCSTFDSSPSIGSIGQVIDVGMETFASRFVPVVVGAPALGRYCVFGNLFARCGGQPDIHRLDRHPSMSRHPITPMNEADLRLHLQKQTAKQIGLLDVLNLDLQAQDLKRQFDSLVNSGNKIVLIDVLEERHLEKIGALLSVSAQAEHPLFVVGSSGVESALCTDWSQTGRASKSVSFRPVPADKPIIALCGSCSPATGAQIKWAISHGFQEIVIDAFRTDAAFSQAVKSSVAAIQSGKSVCIHTRGTLRTGARSKNPAELGHTLAKILLAVLKQTPVRRVIAAGGDTSSQLARALGIEAVEMIGQLTRGSPLCKAMSSNLLIDGLEITFKGGQIGDEDFFGMVQKGT